MTAGSPGAIRESQRGRAFELSAAAVTAAGKFVLGDLLGLGLSFVIAACLFWFGYVIVSVGRDRSVLDRWGFTRRGTARAGREAAPFAALALAGFVVYGLVTGRALVNGRLLILLAAYPIWGTIQQFLVVAVVADNAVALSRGRVPEWVAVLLAALLFAAVHLPVYPLVIATFFLGIMTTVLFFRTRSMWVPGILHGWYASVFYHFVLGEDPLGSLLSGAFAL
jgi:membrane protease YdiL (CAAX protease family)